MARPQRPIIKGAAAGLWNIPALLWRSFCHLRKRSSRCRPRERIGCSVGCLWGGLSAFDIGYRHPASFAKIGVFSGSFWWRKKAYVKSDVADRSRILLDVIRDSKFALHLQFWFQTGTEDEKADRNNNGVIDSIDDTLDLIKELKEKGYSYPGDITYVEITGGKHDLPTWEKIFPQFVKWAFGRKA